MSGGFLPPHHVGNGRYRNPEAWNVKEHTFSDLWQLMTRTGPPSVERERSETPYVHETTAVDHGLLHSPTTKLQMTWMGHASFLVQQEGFTYLTDPVFSKYCAPFQIAGPARLVDPPCAVADMPPLDCIMLSHTHYDHLDSGSVASILAKEQADLAARDALLAAGEGPTNPQLARFAGTAWVVPLGVGKQLVDGFGVAADSIVELDWFQAAEVRRGEAPAGADPAEWTALQPGAASPGHSLRFRRVASDGEAPSAAHPYGTGRFHAPAADEAANDAPNGPAGAAASSGGGSPGSGNLAQSAIRFVCCPAQHFTQRTAFDRNASVWASWAAVSADRRFYFSGDTGYYAFPPLPEAELDRMVEDGEVQPCPAFAEIGERVGPFDGAGLPIGAYSPRWFMAAVHASPEDSVKMHRDLRVTGTSIGMHWSTYRLTNEPLGEPPARLQRAVAAAEAAGAMDGEFVAVAHGATLGH